MTLRTLVLASAGAAAMLASRPSHADSVTDVANGTSIFVQYAHAILDGNSYRTAGIVVAKPAGTLNFPLPASAIGLNLPITLHLSGTSIGGNIIQFTFNDAFSDVDITGNGDLLTGASGVLLVIASPLAGAQSAICNNTSCPGDVSLELVGATVTATGTWGSEPVTLESARGVGGVPRARMNGLVAPTTSTDSHGTVYPFCSATNATTPGDLVVALTGVAPSGGTRVDLTAPHGFGLPTSIIVPQGLTSYDVPFTVPVNFVGSIELTAAAGGAVSSAELVVDPAIDCQPPGSRPSYEAYVPPLLVGCTQCSEFVDLNDENWQLTQVGSQLMVIIDGAVSPLLKAFPQATAVGADALNDSGMIAGRMTVGGVTQAYRANFAYGAHGAQLLGAMVPEDIGSSGTVVGYRSDANGLHHPVFNSGRGVTDIALASSYGIEEARALRISPSGQVIGTFTGNDGVIRGYRWVDGTTYTLPNIGSTPGIPVAVDRMNDIAVNSKSGAAIIGADGTVLALGNPSGYVGFQVTSLNRYGYAVGNASPAIGLAAVSQGFVWIPKRGFVALTNYVKGLSVDQALRITDTNQVVVHGTTSAGIADLYLITL